MPKNPAEPNVPIADARLLDLGYNTVEMWARVTPAEVAALARQLLGCRRALRYLQESTVTDRKRPASSKNRLNFGVFVSHHDTP